MQHLMGDYLREYGRLVDSPTDGDKGLDNFTAAAKVLSTGHRRGAHNHTVTDMGVICGIYSTPVVYQAHTLYTGHLLIINVAY